MINVWEKDGVLVRTERNQQLNLVIASLRPNNNNNKKSSVFEFSALPKTVIGVLSLWLFSSASQYVDMFEFRESKSQTRTLNTVTKF